MDFERISACGLDCEGCPKKVHGACAGCKALDGCVDEWEGQCPIHACAKKRGAVFCGACADFPCKELPVWFHWDPKIVEKLQGLKSEYETHLSDQN